MFVVITSKILAVGMKTGQRIETGLPVTTRLVVLSNRLQIWKNWQKRRTPRRNVMGTTDRQGCLVPKHLENLKLGTENQLSELRNGMAGRTVTDSSEKLSL